MVNIDDFLKHPKVQYIPLSVENSREGVWQNPFNSGPDLYIYQNPEDLSSKLSHLDLPQINASPEDMTNNLVIIALNFEVKRGYFRFLTTKFIGEEKEGHYQVFFVTKKYFPRRVLHFTLYSEEGKKMAWENIEILK